jgi:ubiquinone/menaquinone biosynthesis C-methylase UbiE
MQIRTFRSWLTVCLVCLCASLACAQEATDNTAIPPARTKYLGRTIAQTMSFHGAPWLVRDNREDEERTSEVLKQLELKPGMVVCDLGCGNGFYTLLMAPQVAPEGKVLAVDIQPEMLHLLELRSETQGFDNVEAVLGTLVDPHLPSGEVDLVLLVDVYHEFSHPEQMLSALRKSLSPTGLIALLEYREEDPNVPIKPLHKMSKRQIMKEYRANGFRLAKQYDGLPWQHMMFFAADPAWSPAATSQPTDE